MTVLERQVRAAQRRLWWNRWFGELCGCLLMAAGLFAALVVTQRLWNLPIPLGSLALALLALGTLVSIARTIIRRDGALAAATALDLAAGLRERLSSGFLCRSNSDVFAQAVVADAERVGASLAVRQHLRFGVPKHLASASIMTAVAALCLLLPAGWLTKDAEAKSVQDAALVTQAQADVRRSAEAVRRIAETTPTLEEFKDDAEELDKQAGAPLEREQLRHEASKKIDNLADAVKQRREDGKYEEAQELRKMLRGIKSPENAETPTERLSTALAQGDLKAAKEEIEAVKEQLATLKADADKEIVDQLNRQLEELAKQLEKNAGEEKIEEALKQAGLNKDDIERALQSLDKKDLDQIKKDLEKKGLNKEKVEQLAKQLQQKKNAGSAAKQLAQNLKQAGAKAQDGQTGDAMESMTLAQEQLSALEQAQAEAAQLDSALAELQNERGNLGQKPCSDCKGTGQSGDKPCPDCNGTGQGGNRPGSGSKKGGGMGSLGRGSGGNAPTEATAVGFRTERQTVHTGKGAIIGQTLVDGEQIKGEVKSNLVEIVSAGEREASDRIDRDRVPRQYQGAVKAYFTNVQDSLKKLKSDAGTGKSVPTNGTDQKPTENPKQD